jgi:hypothetical protein
MKMKKMKKKPWMDETFEVVKIFKLWMRRIPHGCIYENPKN